MAVSKDGSERGRVDARSLFQKLVETRLATGEPYIVFADHVNNAMPKHHRDLGLKVSTSNLCSEITLPTGKDHLGNDRTAVCCLSSLNLETWDEWKDAPGFIGRIGTLLGENGINIGTFNLGRREAGGEAVLLLSVDTPVPAELRDQACHLPGVKRVMALAF